MPSENVTISVNADSLEANLSKAMRATGAHYDELGRLVTQEGKFAGALSAAKVRMGYYIDSQGKMRDAQNRFVEGLNATQLAMRMYIDAHGDVRDAEGKFIEQSAQKVKALEAARKAATDTLSNLSQLSSSMALLSTAFTNGGREGSAFARTMKEITEGTGAILGYTGAIITLTDSIKKLAKTKLLFNGFSGVLAASTLGAVGLAYAFGKLTQVESDSNSILEKEIDSIKRLTDAHDRLQRTIAQNGTFNTSLSMVNQTSVGDYEQLKKMERMLNERRELVEKEASFWRKQAGKEEKRIEYETPWWNPFQYDLPFGISDWFREGMTDAQERRDRADKKSEELKKALDSNKEAQVNSLLSMFKSDIGKDTAGELAERAKFYVDRIKNESIKAEHLGTAQEALASVYQKYADSFRIDSTDKLNEAMARAAKDFGETSEEYKKVTQTLRETYDKNKLAQSENYIESLRDQMKTPADRLREEQNKLKEAYHAGAVSFEELARMNSFLRDKYEERADKFEKDEPQQRVEEYSAPKSLNYGSQQLYEVLTQRQNDQTQQKMAQSLDAMRRQSEDANDYLRDMRDGILAFNDMGVTV